MLRTFSERQQPETPGMAFPKHCGVVATGAAEGSRRLAKRRDRCGAGASRSRESDRGCAVDTAQRKHRQTGIARQGRPARWTECQCAGVAPGREQGRQENQVDAGPARTHEIAAPVGGAGGRLHGEWRNVAIAVPVTQMDAGTQRPS